MSTIIFFIMDSGHIFWRMQVYPDATGSSPFLIVNDQKKLMILPLVFSHKEAHDTSRPALSSGVSHTAEGYQFPMEKWVHFGFEVQNAD